MSSARTRTVRANSERGNPSAALARAPFIGALLRHAFIAAQARTLEVLAARGFTDLNEAHLNVFRFPPPDGMRPSELAKRAAMTKQAMNYLLGQLERMGYLERRAARSADRRLVHLTPKGWRVIEANLEAIQALERDWAAALGQKCFADLVAALRVLASFDAKSSARAVGDPHVPSKPRQASLS
ncbi:MAG: MarR family winged helix-turn-helix transcriptional regulator [Stellaceae bacterium]